MVQGRQCRMDQKKVVEITGARTKTRMDGENVASPFWVPRGR